MADVNGRKRKRQSNGDELSNKKIALPAGPTEVVHLNDEGVRPVLLSTAKGISIPDKSMSFKGYANPRTNQAILHSSDHPRLDYIAVPSNDEYEHYVAIYDPATKKISLAPAYHNVLRAVVRTEPPQADASKKTQSQLRVQLGQEFGTKKAKKAIASRTINAITDAGGKSKDMQDAVLDAAAELAGEAEDEAAQLLKTLSSKPIPMPNIAAETVEEVYSIDTLAPPEDMRQIDVKEWRQKTRASINIEVHHRYVAYNIKRICELEDRAKLKALRYVALLLRFHDALRPAGKSGKKVPKQDALLERLSDYPKPLVDSIRKRFSENNELTKWHIEKLQTTIFALSLYIDDHSSVTRWLRDDLKLDNKVVAQFGHELGCKLRPMTEAEIEVVSKAEQKKLTKAEAALVKVIVLKLPLEFPKLRSGRRK